MSSARSKPGEDTTWHDRTEGVLCIYLSSWDHVMGPQLVFCWRMEPAIPGEDTHSGDAEDVRSTPHYLKCHQFLENPEAFLVRKEAPQQASCRPTEVEETYGSSALQLLHGGLEQRHTRSCLLLLPDKRAALHAVTFNLAGSPVSITAVFRLAALKDLWLLLSLTDLTLARVALICRTPGVILFQCFLLCFQGAIK